MLLIDLDVSNFKLSRLTLELISPKFLNELLLKLIKILLSDLLPI